MDLKRCVWYSIFFQERLIMIWQTSGPSRNSRISVLLNLIYPARGFNNCMQLYFISFKLMLFVAQKCLKIAFDVFFFCNCFFLLLLANSQKLREKKTDEVIFSKFLNLPRGHLRFLFFIFGFEAIFTLDIFLFF